MLFPSALAALAIMANPAAAATWYFLRYYAPDGANFTTFSGEIVVPDLPQAAIYYLWPGLQPRDSSGVYQNVMNGITGTWHFGSGWCCGNPTLSWGSQFDTYGGETVWFNNFLLSDNSAWNSTIVREEDNTVIKDSFPIAYKSFNQAIFAIELYDVTWDFGALEFKNVKIIAEGSSDSSWCTSDPENYNDATVYSISGASASVSDTTVTCTFDTVILESPA
ncbi:hypothetical protein NKR23_g6514 [Pleurostoma richardsiae]|uniref:Uncharacterized protein n=1 Tax=Pleurostoma richardsiae TaxID=41990 RepID=A0AA38VHP0_9PEZI|nr:hypothetical protein NKR23_g6514 [Pleurostoma richardsiae]